MLTPTGDKVLVRPDDPTRLSPGGLHLPETMRETTQLGRVLAAGPGERSDADGSLTPMQVSEGDRIVFSPYAGSEVTVDDEQLLILRSGEVLARVED